MLCHDDIRTLRCVTCGAGLAFRGFLRGVRLDDGVLGCVRCQARFPVEQGIARVYREDRVRGTDRLLRAVYDGLPSVHDPLVRFSFPLAVGESEEKSRDRYFARIALEDAVPAAPELPLRVLEVGVGTGSNVPVIRERLRARLKGRDAVEIWGVDLSLGMLGLLQRRMRFVDDNQTRALAADAHALPFADGFFDRVFHVGAINGYRDKRTALAEMARVARPGTPIVVVDEQLDPGARHGLSHRLFFKMMTFYDPDPRPPIDDLPAGAGEVTVDQLGRFFYCLTFKMKAQKKADDKADAISDR